MKLAAGSLVNPRVRLVRPLGEGAMGTVWVAEHLTLGTTVAVKFIAPELLGRDDPEVLGRFEREAKAAALIKSPNVVHILDFGTTDEGIPYIVMERLMGSSLSEWLELSGSLGLHETSVVVTQVARALSKAHQLGIIHRDVKPQNIFLMDDESSYDGEGPLVKVLDFGIAKHAEVPEGLTLPGMVIGTPEYMCPDQLLESQEVDKQADLWSLAVVSYQALTGELPFTGRTLAQLVGVLVRREYPPASALRPELPPAVDRFFERAFHAEPQKRFDDALELSAALREALAPTPVGLSPVSGAPGQSRAPVSDAPVPEEPRESLTPADPGSMRGVLASIQDAARISLDEVAREVRHSPARRRALLAAGGGLALGVVIALAVHAARPERAPSAAATTASVSAKPPRETGAVFVAGGPFIAGCQTSDALCPAGALPRTEVALGDFVIDRHEVTVAEYRACATAGACSVDGLTFDVVGCNWNEAGRAEHPINCVSWEQADAYCRWVGGALPTEAQWEKAARGSEGRPHPWGTEPPSCALAVMSDERGQGCGRDGTWHVGSRPQGASPAGALDMAGNVREWMADWYSERPDAAALASGPAHGPARGTERVVRGGSFADGQEALRTTVRMHLPPPTRAVDLGFRCVRRSG